MSLLDLITGNVGNQVATEAENKFGISKSQMIALAAVAAPLIISYLRNKSQDAKEAEALNNALDRDHDGSILNNPSSALEREQEGLIDISPLDKNSLTFADFQPEAFVQKDMELSLTIRNLNIQFEVTKKRFE